MDEHEQKSCKPCCVYTAITNIVFLVFGSMLVSLGRDLNSMTNPVYSVQYVHKITTDWTTVPFIDIYVTNSTFCKYGSIEVFQKPSWLTSSSSGSWCECSSETCQKDAVTGGYVGCYSQLTKRPCTDIQLSYGCLDVAENYF